MYHRQSAGPRDFLAETILGIGSQWVGGSESPHTVNIHCVMFLIYNSVPCLPVSPTRGLPEATQEAEECGADCGRGWPSRKVNTVVPGPWEASAPHALFILVIVHRTVMWDTLQSASLSWVKVLPVEIKECLPQFCRKS